VAAVFGPDALQRIAGVDPFVSRDGDAVRVIVAFDSDPHAATAIGHLDDLEAAMPGLLAQSGLSDARASYAGDTPLAAETVDQLKGDSGKIAAVVIIANLLLLMVFLRSVLAPVLLVAASLLAVAATLGIAVWLLQVQLGQDGLTYFVPFATCVLLVSLGSDYNVFVTGRVWQEAERRPLPDAIALAAPRASRAIRVAGLTLAASFALLAIVPVLAFREFALVMAIGVLVETFVVRSLLVPALVALFGYASGWPGRRIRMGRASTEGST
jgi:RND superfamily putative drug exporter